MISPTSSVRFGNAPAPTSNNIFERPGAFSKTETDTVDITAPKKKSSTGKKVLGVVAGLAVVAGLLAFGQKKGVLKIIASENMANAKWYERVGSYLGQAGEAIAKYAYELPKEKITGLFSKS